MAAKYPDLKIQLDGTESGHEVLRRAQIVMFRAAYELGQDLRNDARTMVYTATGYTPPASGMDYGVPTNLHEACDYATALSEVENFITVELVS